MKTITSISRQPSPNKPAHAVTRSSKTPVRFNGSDLGAALPAQQTSTGRPAEKEDLAEKHPEIVERPNAAHATWELEIPVQAPPSAIRSLLEDKDHSVKHREWHTAEQVVHPL
jgi:hypothetical protein